MKESAGNEFLNYILAVRRHREVPDLRYDNYWVAKSRRVSVVKTGWSDFIQFVEGRGTLPRRNIVDLAEISVDNHGTATNGEKRGSSRHLNIHA